MHINNEEPIPSAEVKKILLKKSKEKELTYEQKITLDYLKKFSKLKDNELQQLNESLTQIEKLKPRHIVNIIDNLPEDLDDLRLLFANDRIDLSDSDKKKILDAVKSVL